MNIVGLGWSIGGIIGPFIIRPFLSPDADDVDVGNCTLVTCVHDMTTASTADGNRYPDGSRIEIPYVICGVVMTIFGGCLIVLHICVPLSRFNMITKKSRENDDPKSIKAKLQASIHLLHPGNCAHKSNACTVFFLVAFFTYVFLTQGVAIFLYEHLGVWLVEGNLKIDKQYAAFLIALTSITSSLGRVTFSVVGKFVSVQIMASFVMAVLCIMFIILPLLGVRGKTEFTVCLCIMSFLGGPVWAFGVSWTNNYITLTAMAYSLSPLANSLSGTIFQPLAGSMLVSDNLDKLMHTAAIFGTIRGLLFLAMQTAGCHHGIACCNLYIFS